MGVHDDEIRRRVKAAREAKGLSQSELASSMNARGSDFKQQTINKIEGGDRKVSAAELVALASALDTSAASLLGLGEDRESLLIAGARLEEAMRNLHSSSMAYGRAMLAYAMAADGIETLHTNDEHFIKAGLLKQTPGWIASGDVFHSLVATLGVDRVQVLGEHATALLAAIEAEHDLLHKNDG